jgi:sulfoxide reductase heme-binding subunit YedZ
MILAVTSSQALWYLTRGSGLVSLILLTVSMGLGIAQFERWTGPTGQRFVVTHIHRNASLLAVVFLGVHIATSIVDGFAPIGWIDAVIPFGSPYRSLWLGLGALSFDLVLALVITSLLRTRISYGAWKAVHWTAYLCWPLAFVHGLGTGTDGRVGWVQVVDLACLGLMLLAVAWRLVADWEQHGAARGIAATVTAISLFALGAWAYQGPMQKGWARKAGTPASLLGGGAVDSAAADTTTAPADFAPPFSAAANGTVTQSGTAVDQTVLLDGSVTGEATGHLSVTIEGTAVDGGGVRLKSGTVAMGPADAPTLWSGPITRLSGDLIIATVKGPGATTANASIQVAVSSDRRSFSGTVATTGGG